MPSLRTAVPLVAGLAVGVAGAILFLQSMPPPAGSPEERIGKLEAQLKTANNRVAALEAADPRGRKRPGRTLADGARGIAEDFRDGKPVSPDDVLRAMQPFIRDMSPILERMRNKDMQRQSDSMAGELARKYSLTPAQQESLQKWLRTRAEEESKRYVDLISQSGITADELGKAQRDIRLDDGLDTFMERTLSGEKLAAFRTQHMLEKVDRVQGEADMKVERLNQIVQLDETQQGQVFGMMARGAHDFEPGMSFEGLGTDTAPLATGASRNDALMKILKPEQRATYQAELDRRREDARKNLAEMGLSLPDGANFDPLDF